jgi:uncharacterized membrane protein
MTPDLMAWATLLWHTVLLRPYVFVFLLIFLAAAARDIGWKCGLVFFLWGWAVAFVAEYASTRIGIPFGMYHYTGATVGLELYLSNVPFFDSISFAFLAYFAFCLARRTLSQSPAAGVVLLAGCLMMLLDVVMDPLAVRGDRWFLGRVFYYPEGGTYFGVPLSNFAGWAVVGWLTVGGYLAITGRYGTRAAGERSSTPGIALYYAVLVFNLALTLWIGEWRLLAAGILVHAVGFLLLYAVNVAVRPTRLRVRSVAGSAVPEADHQLVRRRTSRS